MNIFQELKPQAVWDIFYEITRVPRPSKREAKIRAWLEDFARRNSIECRCDAIGNVFMSVPAAQGCESMAEITLQAHMDMVCEKLYDREIDFDVDPIEAYVEDGWVKARGTTLGADCGIGMALALAALTSQELKHGKLNALFTVDEETGLTGAFNLGEGMLSGKYLLNLDSEDEGQIFIGCAGGVDTMAKMPTQWEDAPLGMKAVSVEVTGLLGGHSGDDIGRGRACANKVIARLISGAGDCRIASLDGGNLRNAIAREAKCVILVEDSSRAMEALSRTAEDIVAEYSRTEKQMRIVFELCDAPRRVLSLQCGRAVVGALLSVAHGVLRMSDAVPGLVETSTNLASVHVSEQSISIVTSQRSSVESAKHYAALSVESAFRMAGFEVSHSDGYPGWTPDTDTKLLKTTVASYEKLFGHKPEVLAIHAGLECGLFLSRYPGTQMISFGPTLRQVHTPDERLEIATVDMVWRHLCDIIETID